MSLVPTHVSSRQTVAGAVRSSKPPRVTISIAQRRCRGAFTVHLLGIQKAILANAQWQGLRLELYVFLGLVYFVGSFAMSWYSRRLETRLGVGER